MTDVLRGTTAAPGDVRVWGPDHLFNEANTSDSGGTTQGTCIALDANFDCLVNETIVFADGRTLQMQGIQLGGGQPSSRTIVGGSGQYLGATGTILVAPTSDLKLWKKTIAINMPSR
jgi:hypothetical protein